MERRSAIAPTYDQIRPMRREVTTSTFPVYKDLPEHLVSVESHPDTTAAHVLATCAAYSYSDEQTVALMMTRLGLEQNRCLKLFMGVDAMFICSTAYLVQSACGKVVILSYRGTEPGNFINWLTDSDVNPEKVEIQFPGAMGQFLVHGGFYRNVLATRYQVIDALERALRGQAIVDRKDVDGAKVAASVPNQLQALYITGHSLGAAMAALMGVMLVTEPSYAPLADKLRGVYTYGQPMIGEPSFAAACSKHPFLRRNVIRYVYEHDLVPKLPPTLSGPFEHFGPELRYSGGKWTPSEAPTTQLNRVLEAITTIVPEFAAHQVPALQKLPFFRYSMYHHMPNHYIAALKPEHVTSEFGD